MSCSRVGGCANFHLLNRGQKRLALDLKAPEERAQLLPLLATTGLLVEQFRPGLSRIRAETSDHWIAVFTKSDSCCSIVRTLQETMADTHFRSRGAFAESIANDLGEVTSAMPTSMCGPFKVCPDAILSAWSLGPMQPNSSTPPRSRLTGKIPVLRAITIGTPGASGGRNETRTGRHTRAAESAKGWGQ
jgi:hypothetical protein